MRSVHFVGIGGSGMSGIAEVLLDQGYQITGSDLSPSGVTERLATLGARCFASHAAEHVAGADVVVTSAAISDGNPEVAEARRRHVPVIPRAEMLAELMRVKYGVAVGGSHGKTTTTSLVATVLDAAGLDPTVVVGGRVGRTGTGGRLGRGEFLVAEADESDRSFLRLSPTIAVVTNVDREHLDTYRDLADVQEAFIGFANRVPFYGAAVVCVDDPAVCEILPRLERRVVGYGLQPARGAQLEAARVELGPSGSRFEVLLKGAALGHVELPIPGAHNVANALAAVAVAIELDVPFQRAREGLAIFAGVERRFQQRGAAAGVAVIDDYGHHPTEIRAVLAALRCAAGERRTVVLFQPHRYSRSRALWAELASAFPGADRVLVTDIYPAGEAPVPNVDAARLATAIAANGVDAEYAGDLQTAGERLKSETRPGDVVLTLGAGDVWKAGELLLAARGGRR